MIDTLHNVRVLVSGISGFIGSHLARRLVKDGAEVSGLVRKSSSLWRIEDLKDLVRLYYADITDFESIKKACQEIRPQKVFHLAAYVNVSRSLEVMDKAVEVNIEGTLNLLRALDGTDYDCFVNTGTCEEYGDNPVPFREDQMPNPVSPYSASKAAATMFCHMMYKTHDLPIVMLRPFLTYGPAQESDMLIPSLIRKALKGESFDMTEGKQTREFNYVEDVVDGFIKASVTPEAVGAIINIGNGREYSIRDVVDMVLKLMKSPIKPRFGALSYRPGEAWHFYCDNSKACRILGWRPSVSLECGLNMTIDWFLKHFVTEQQWHG